MSPPPTFPVVRDGEGGGGGGGELNHEIKSEEIENPPHREELHLSYLRGPD